MTRGEIWWIDFGVPVGSLPAYRRPAVIMQTNSSLNTLVVIPLTTNLLAGNYYPNVVLEKNKTRLPKDSVAVIHLIGAVNKFNFIEKIARLDKSEYDKLVQAVLTLTTEDKPTTKNET